MRMFISLVSVLLLTLPTLAAKRVKVDRGYYSGISFLKFNQLAQLPRNEQAKYIRTLRQMYQDIEKTQQELKISNSAWMPNAREHKDLYAMIFGPDANAAGDCISGTLADGTCSTHERGAQVSDRCVYGYNLNFYNRARGAVKGAYPFRCSQPPTCTVGKSTKGFVCDVGGHITGLSGKDACVRADLNRGITAQCEEQRLKLSNGFVNTDEYSLSDLMADVDKGFGFDTGEVSLEFMKSERAKQLIEKLIASRFNDHSYATLITLMELYKKKGIKFPTNNQDILALQKNFDGFINTIDGIFGDYMDMCNQELGKDVIKNIRDLSNEKPGTFNYNLDKDRRELLLAAEARGEKITNRNVLQKPQCINIEARITKLENATEELGRKMPKTRDPRYTPPQVPPVPPAPPVEDIQAVGCSDGGELENSLIFSHIGRCSICAMEKSVNNIGGGTTDDLDALPDENGYRPQTGHYRASKKWTALMSTMIKACGVTNHTGQNVEQFNEMWQIFGSCSQDTYNWDTAGQRLDQKDIDMVQDWANHNYWNEKEAPVKNSWWDRFRGNKDGYFTPEPDKNKDFARIFGISYTQATNVFCDPSRFVSDDIRLEVDDKGYAKAKLKKNSNKRKVAQEGLSKSEQRKLDSRVTKACKNERKGRYRDQCETLKRQQFLAERAGLETETAAGKPTTRNVRRAEGQKRMNYAINNNKILNESPPGVPSNAKGLRNCMEEGLERAKRNSNPETPGAMCMKTVPLDIADLKNQMESQLAPGNIIVDQQDCLIGQQTEKHGRNGLSLAFVTSGVSSDLARMSVPGTREFHNSDNPVKVNTNVKKRRLGKQKVGKVGVTADVYQASGSIFGHDEGSYNYQVMTKQVACTDYWGASDYSVPDLRTRGGRQ